jgi:V/A-type H+-transporting ATPase subunit F
MRFYCLADEDTVRGFRLAGIDGEAATSAETAAKALTGALALHEQMIIILTPQVASWLQAAIRRSSPDTEAPLFIILPDISKPAAEGVRDSYDQMQKAIGFSISGEVPQ